MTAKTSEWISKRVQSNSQKVSSLPGWHRRAIELNDAKAKRADRGKNVLESDLALAE